MKFLFTLISIIHFLPIFSQQGDIPYSIPQHRRLEIGFVFAPGISYRTLVNHDTTSTGPAIIEIRNKNEKPKTSYKTGISLKYPICEKAGLTTGIYYARNGYQQNTKDASWPSQDTTGNYPGPGSSSTIKSSYNFRSIEIPLLFDYTFHKSRLSYSIGIGGSYNYFLGATFSYKITEDNGEVQEATSKLIGPYHQGSVSLLLKTGISYSLNENTSIHLDPTFQYDVTQMLDEVLINERLLNFGLHIGYFMTL